MWFNSVGIVILLFEVVVDGGCVVFIFVRSVFAVYLVAVVGHCVVAGIVCVVLLVFGMVLFVGDCLCLLVDFVVLYVWCGICI